MGTGTKIDILEHECLQKHEELHRMLTEEKENENMRQLIPVESNRDLLLSGLEYYGQSEVPGKDTNNPVIVDMIKQAWEWANDDEIPWCSFFINAMANKNAYETPPTDQVGMARSWLDVGKAVSSPKLGDLVIMWRKSISSESGHVGIFVNKIGDIVYILGGNQRNQVNISGYKIDRILGYRRLRKKNLNGSGIA